MAGHSKWNNIKRKKEKTDSARAKVFTKIGREISVAVKSGGADPAANAKLRDAIAKAKQNNVPTDNIERLIKKAAGSADTSNYDEMIYEGYGAGGVAVIVETLTDNRNRTAGDLRHYFDKFGGSLGQSGSVMFMFDKKGVIGIASGEFDEDKILEDALDSGAQDFEPGEEGYIILTDPSDLGKVRVALEQKGYDIALSEIQYIPQTTASVDGDAHIKVDRLMDMLEENDDVTNVFNNLED